MKNTTTLKELFYRFVIHHSLFLEKMGLLKRNMEASDEDGISVGTISF
jgi:hypothetical protein